MILTLLFLAVVAFIIIQGGDESEKIFMIPENHMQMKNIHFIRMLDNKGGYSEITAEEGYLDNDDSIIYLNQSYIYMDDKINILKIYSDNATFVVDKTIHAKGNIKGIWNKMNFKVSPEGMFWYDFDAARGVAGKNVYLEENGSTILTGHMNYYEKNKIVTFTDNVTMEFTGSK